MRVVGGEARGRRLVAPPGAGTRPTADRVREAMFDMVESLGGVEGAAVADLFAGSGALGVEAISRGAERATFVETDRGALAALRANLAVLGARAQRAQVVRADVLAWLGGGATAAAGA
ncbi:MAG: RsmD family RNA methyltransferase, partial [Acidimicrobiales bacterium]